MNSTTRRRVAAAAVAAGALMTVGGLFSSAFFTDTASIDNNDFAFGTLDLATTPTGSTPLFSLPAASPGEQWTGPLLVNNSGTMDLRYALETVVAGSDLLGQGLDLIIKSGVTTCTDAGFGGSGSVLYNGDLGVAAGRQVLGDKAQGAQAGDRVLSAGSNETLCVQVAAPLTLDEATYGGLSTNTSIQFFAEQTQNNP